MKKISPPDTIHSDEHLLIRYSKGNNDKLVLAFTGVQHGLGGIPMQEFAGTATGKDHNHVVFISDMKRTWFSSDGICEKIAEKVSNLASEHDLKSMDSIGNSMGGYGAIRMSDLLPFQRVLAFAPQVSMHPDVIDEHRWSAFRPYFGADLIHSVDEVILRNDLTKFFTFFGRKSSADLRQAALLTPTPQLDVFLLNDCAHDVGKYLKANDLLSDISEIAFSDREDPSSEIRALINALA